MHSKSHDGYYTVAYIRLHVPGIKGAEFYNEIRKHQAKIIFSPNLHVPFNFIKEDQIL